MNVEQFVERYPHLPLYAYRFIDFMFARWTDDANTLLKVVAENCGTHEKMLVDIDLTIDTAWREEAWRWR